jgi:large subunit ribosomal protein L2
MNILFLRKIGNERISFGKLLTGFRALRAKEGLEFPTARSAQYPGGGWGATRHAKPRIPQGTSSLKTHSKAVSEKSLIGSITRSTGRNNRGVITSGQKGGGHKQKYRFINFRRSGEAEWGAKRLGVDYVKPARRGPLDQNMGFGGELRNSLVGDEAASPQDPFETATLSNGARSAHAKVQRIEYDPNRNAEIALISYSNGKKSYILHPLGLKVGSSILASANAPSTIGNALPLFSLPLGSIIHSVELHPGSGGVIARAAGAQAQILAKEGNQVSLRLPSGEIRLINNQCWASVGQVGNIDFMNRSDAKHSKAGRTRWLGKRPHVRGSAKNPVDHPHGGGEGRVGIGHKHPLTPWGKCALGKKTRNKKKYSTPYILSR